MVRGLTGSAAFMLHNGTITEGVMGPEGGLVGEQHAMLKVMLVSRIILSTYSSMLFVAGITCNSVVLRVLKNRSKRRIHLWPYLMSLALSNICLLGLETSRYAVKGIMEVNYTVYNIGVCFVHRWLVLTSLITSNWLMVFITFGRWYILRHPTSSLFKNTNMGLSVGLLVAFNGGLVVFVLMKILVFRDSRIEGEDISACTMFRERSREYVMVPVITYTPLLMAVTLNFMLYRQVKVQVEDTMIPTTATQLSKLFYYRRLALLAVVASVHLLVTAIPLVIVSVGGSLMFDSKTPLSAAKTQLVKRCCRLAWYGAYATNCLILCLQGAHFRNHMYTLILGWFGNKGFNTCRTQVERFLNSGHVSNDIPLQLERSFLDFPRDYPKETDNELAIRSTPHSTMSVIDKSTTPGAHSTSHLTGH